MLAGAHSGGEPSLDEIYMSPPEVSPTVHWANKRAYTDHHHHHLDEGSGKRTTLRWDKTYAEAYIYSFYYTITVCYTFMTELQVTLSALFSSRSNTL